MTGKQLEAIALIPLIQAVLCSDCEAVSNGKNACPACGSAAIYPIERWLQRPSAPIQAAVEKFYSTRIPWEFR